MQQLNINSNHQQIRQQHFVQFRTKTERISRFDCLQTLSVKQKLQLLCSPAAAGRELRKALKSFYFISFSLIFVYLCTSLFESVHSDCATLSYCCSLFYYNCFAA